MDVNIRTDDGVHIVTLSGELNASTSTAVKEQIAPLATSGARILLDLSAVTFVSSAGLRLLLGTYRQVSERKGAIALVGVSEDLSETMSVTGFLTFFLVYDSLTTGLRALRLGA